MTIPRTLAAAAILVGLAIGITRTASADQTMNGHYIGTVTGPRGVGTISTHWYFTPCGVGCSDVATLGRATLVNGQWVLDGTPPLKCDDGTFVADVATAHYTWDPDTLAGTVLATQTKEACGYVPGSASGNFRLIPARGRAD
jgi:hypothetical protein